MPYWYARSAPIGDASDLRRVGSGREGPCRANALTHTHGARRPAFSSAVVDRPWAQKHEGRLMHGKLIDSPSSSSWPTNGKPRMSTPRRCPGHVPRPGRETPLSPSEECILRRPDNQDKQARGPQQCIESSAQVRPDNLTSPTGSSAGDVFGATVRTPLLDLAVSEATRVERIHTGSDAPGGVTAFERVRVIGRHPRRRWDRARAAHRCTRARTDAGARARQSPTMR